MDEKYKLVLAGPVTHVHRSYFKAVLAELNNLELNDRVHIVDNFIDNPQDYSSSALQYLKETDILISAHYWDPSSPKIFENEDLKDLENLKIVGDITCDINGSVPTTIRSTTIE